FPAIDDDGFVMWDTAAINLYLARKYGSPLLPRTAHGEGRALQWAFFMANDIEPPLLALHRHRTELPPHRRHTALADDCQRQLTNKLAVLEGQLERTDYFGGRRWDLADFAVASVLCAMCTMKLDLWHAPRLEAWLTESIERPAAREAYRLRE